MPSTKRPNSELSERDEQNKNKSVKKSFELTARSDEKNNQSSALMTAFDSGATAKLATVLKEINVSYPKGIDQLLESIPLNEYWRFFLDGAHQRQGQTWVHYDWSETGYLTGMSAGFIKVLDQLKSKSGLTLEFIKTLHSEAIGGVRVAHYEHKKEANRYEFDNSYNFGVRIDTCLSFSQKGVEEILIRIARGNPILRIQYGAFLDKIIDAKNIKTYSDLRRLSQEIFESGGCRTMSSIGLNDITSYRKIAEQHFQKMINDYLVSMQTIIQPIDKLKRIIEFVTECEQSHPYLDGNGRTFCVLMLDYLLIQNNFPPIIMDDPNNFDLCDQPILVACVIEGMQSTLNLLKQKELYGKKTADILKGYDAASQKIYNDSYEILKKHLQVSVMPVKVAVPTHVPKVKAVVPVMTRANLKALGISSRKFFIPRYKTKVREAFGIDEKAYDKVMQPFK